MLIWYLFPQHFSFIILIIISIATINEYDRQMLPNRQGIPQHPEWNQDREAESAVERREEQQRPSIEWSQEDIEAVQLW